MKVTFLGCKKQLSGPELRLVKVPAGWGCEELWYGETPVTEGQWREVMGGEEEKGERFPKVGVSFVDAEEFCQRLSANTGMKFRRPTEVEQCRGLGVEPEPEKLGEYAVFGMNKVVEVKTKLPNEWGLYDVRGLVREWAESGQEMKALRGGSWNGSRMHARAVCRPDNAPANRYDLIGFRVLCSRPRGEAE